MKCIDLATILHPRFHEEEWYQTMIQRCECGPMDGGCLALAFALKHHVPESKVVVVCDNDRAQHAYLYDHIHDVYWDAYGPHASMDDILTRLQQEEHLVFNNPSLRPWNAYDLIDAQSLMGRFSGDDMHPPVPPTLASQPTTLDH
jgi:hypothetical protein